MKEIQNLLNQVSIIAKKNAELLDANGGRFNMFRMLGVDHYENSHSAILAELLNPKGSHGLKGEFLKIFISNLINEEIIEGFNCENAKVRTEAGTYDGRIDICIEDNQHHAIIIENKVYAEDQWEQLKRYNAWALGEYSAGKYQILYLTLDGKEASLHSGQGVEYKQISYSTDIIKWLEECVYKSARYPLIRETIIQYINHLKQLTNQDMDTKNSQEIVELLSKPENLDATITIYKNYPALCKFIINNIIQKNLKPQLEEFAAKNQLNIHFLEGTETTIKIVFEKNIWERCRMTFVTEGSNLYGFSYINPEQKINNSIIENIKKSIPRAKTDDHCWLFSVRTDIFRTINMDLWINQIKSGEFGEYVVQLFNKLLKSVENCNL